MIVDRQTLTPAQGGSLPTLPTHDWQPWATLPVPSRGLDAASREYSLPRRRCKRCGKIEVGIGDGPAPPGDPACRG